jgi:ectoine hydroxylase-related dioxygenase (phytanoyl-CoA dioxygenase family)
MAASVWTPMTDDQRERFDRDGYIVLPGVLTGDEVARYTAAVDEVYRQAAARGELGPDRSLHRLSAVASCPELSGLVDHPGAFALVWSVLGWNVHVYHSHVDVHPPVSAARPFWWHWHQDGGRQNRELETEPRPRMSVKVAYWLSDVSRPRRGNLLVVPGSHRTNWLPGPPRRDVLWRPPERAVPVEVGPGDAVLFDRRLWHARSDNRSPVVRKAVFFGYTYRWVASRDDVDRLPGQDWWAGLSPVQRQLLGKLPAGSGDHLWGHEPQTVPLYTALRERGLLTVDHPPLAP